jgi:3-dehydroquinate dehydratase/shikimate dehydrogenase
MTLLCVPIMVTEIDAALADCAEAKRLGAQIVEYRIDQIFSGSPEGSPLSDTDAALETREIERLIRSSPLPAIVTCRPTFEGGFYDGDDSSRVSLYQHLGGGGNDAQGLTHPPRYIDVELATLTRSANIRQKVLLAVDHPESDARPGNRAHPLHARLRASPLRPHPPLPRHAGRARGESSSRSPSALAPSATTSNSSISSCEKLIGPTIALGMGEFGLMSRVLAPEVRRVPHVRLSPRCLCDRARPADHHRDPAALPLPLDQQGSTRVYGVIGWPVGHSLSPLIHNAGFESVGHNGVYLPLPIASNADSGGSGDL